MMRFRVWAVVFLSAFVGVSCDLRSPGAGGREDDPKKPEPVAVVFEADFLDIYGPIVVELDGRTVSMDSAAKRDCEEPLAWALPGTEFRALSKNHFFWSGQVPATEGTTCVTVSLDASGLKSGVSGVFQNDPDCLPATVSAAASWGDWSDEQVVGAVQSPWSYEVSEFDPLPNVDPTRFFLQMARLGRLVVIGGGPPAEYGEGHFVWLRRVPSREGCPQMNWEFMAPWEGHRLLWGLDPRDDVWDEAVDE